MGCDSQPGKRTHFLTDYERFAAKTLRIEAEGDVGTQRSVMAGFYCIDGNDVRAIEDNVLASIRISEPCVYNIVVAANERAGWTFDSVCCGYRIDRRDRVLSVPRTRLSRDRNLSNGQRLLSIFSLSVCSCTSSPSRYRRS